LETHEWIDFANKEIIAHNDSFCAFLDIFSMLERMHVHLNGGCTVRDLSDNRKAGFDNMAEAHIGRSGGQMLPKFLNESGKHDSNFPCPALKSYKLFEDPKTGPRCGLRHEIGREFVQLKSVVLAKISELQSDETKALATWMLKENELFLNGWLDSFAKQYTHLTTESGYKDEKGLHVTTTVCRSLFEMVAKERTMVKRVFPLVKNQRARAIAAVLESAMKAHFQQVDIRNHNFTEHPGVASEMVHFVLRQNANSNAQAQVENLEKVMKQSTEESKNADKKLDARLKALETKK
jgi:hypothetical protein